MISLRVFGTAALLALAPAVIAFDTASAQFNPRAGGGGGRPAFASPRLGPAGAGVGRPAFQSPRLGPAVQAPRPGPAFAGRPNFGGGQPAFAGGGGGRPAVGGGGRRFIGPGIGFAAGLAAGAALAPRPGYGYGYGGGYYGGYPAYGSSTYVYSDPDYIDDGTIAVQPQVEVQADTGGDSVEYCRQTYRSYDVRSGTYLGYDGNRYACP